MLIEWFLTQLLGLVQWLLDAFPDVPDIDLSGAAPAIVGFTWLDQSLPLTEFLSGFLVYVGALQFLMVVGAIRSLWRLVPLKSS